MVKNNYDAIVALSFGKGSANSYLAEVVYNIQKDHKCWLILQKEIAKKFYDLLKAKDTQDDLLRRIRIVHKHRQEGKYLSTQEVLEQARKAINGNKIILVAQPLHFQRAWYIAKKLGFKVSEGKTTCVYDKNDPQIWTRNCLLFGIWNLFAWGKCLISKRSRA